MALPNDGSHSYEHRLSSFLDEYAEISKDRPVGRNKKALIKWFRKMVPLNVRFPNYLLMPLESTRFVSQNNAKALELEAKETRVPFCPEACKARSRLQHIEEQLAQIDSGKHTLHTQMSLSGWFREDTTEKKQPGGPSSFSQRKSTRNNARPVSPKSLPKSTQVSCLFSPFV